MKWSPGRLRSDLVVGYKRHVHLRRFTEALAAPGNGRDHASESLGSRLGFDLHLRNVFLGGPHPSKVTCGLMMLGAGATEESRVIAATDRLSQWTTRVESTTRRDIDRAWKVAGDSRC
jgi:hypothetical protein